MPVGQFLKTKEVAKKLKVTVHRISQLVDQGRLKVAERVGTAMLFERAEVDRFAQIPRKPGPKPKEENSFQRRKKSA